MRTFICGGGVTSDQGEERKTGTILWSMVFMTLDGHKNGGGEGLETLHQNR